MAAGKDRRLKTRTASCQNLRILPFCTRSLVSGIRALGYLAGVFVVVVVGDVVKLRCAADLGRKTVHEEEWYRHETALFVPCAIAGFTIPFGMSLPMAQHKAVFSSEVHNE